MTNFSRKQVDDAGEDEIQIVPTAVQDAAMLVCAGRLETGLDHNEFKSLVDELIEAVRQDERARAAAFVPVGNIGQGLKRAKWMKPEDAEQIRADARRFLIENKRAKLPPGYAHRIAAQLGYTQGQVQSAIYNKGKKPP